MIKFTPLSLGIFSRFVDALRPESYSDNPPSIHEGLNEKQALEHVARLLKHSSHSEWSDEEIAIRINGSIEKVGNYNTSSMELICSTTMYLFISRFEDSFANTENKKHVIEDTLTQVMSRLAHNSNHIFQSTLCPTKIEHDTIAKHLDSSNGTYSAFRGTTQSQSIDLARSVDPGMMRVYYFPITTKGININALDSYFAELEYDPSYQEVLRKLQFKIRPHIFREEVETAVSRPIPFENIISIEVVRPDGQSFDKFTSNTSDLKPIKRYIFSDWRSWLNDLEKHNLLIGDK
jgi:hypothetical protein